MDMNSIFRKTAGLVRLVGMSIFAAFFATAAVADIGDLRITEVELPVAPSTTGQVEVTNIGSDTFTLSTALPFCHEFNYASSIPSGTTFTPGESVVVSVTSLNSSSSDLWLFRDTNFNNSASMITGLQYGGGNIARTSQAVSVNLWTDAADFVPLPASGETMQLDSLDPTNPANWVSRPSTLGTFFGTGTQITDPIPGSIPKSSIIVEIETVASNLTSPVGLADPNDGTNRLFVWDQTGQVRIIDSGTLTPTPFLDVSSRLVTLMTGFDERGLLGFAFHPDFTTNGKVYTYTSEPVAGPADFTVPISGSFNHQAVIAEWTVDSSNPDIIDTSTRRELLRIDEPQFNHNGGTIRFGPDDLLYIGLGDGGSADDEGDGHGTDGNGQNPENVLGTLLRIDPDGNDSANGQYGIPATNPFVGVAGVDEIYAFGFRNPFSFSFDSLTGDLYVGDVGQNDIEELDRVQLGGNYGWRLKEGSFFFDPNGGSAGFVTTVPVAPIPSDLQDPIAEYDQDEGISIIAGSLYRGNAFPDMQGLFVMGDFSRDFGPNGRLFVVDPTTGIIEELQIGQDDRALGFAVKGMGRDASGEIYVLGSTTIGPTGSDGVVLKLVSPFTAVTRWELY